MFFIPLSRFVALFFSSVLKKLKNFHDIGLLLQSHDLQFFHRFKGFIFYGSLNTCTTNFNLIFVLPVTLEEYTMRLIYRFLNWSMTVNIFIRSAQRCLEVFEILSSSNEGYQLIISYFKKSPKGSSNKNAIALNELWVRFIFRFSNKQFLCTSLIVISEPKYVRFALVFFWFFGHYDSQIHDWWDILFLQSSFNSLVILRTGFTF